MRMLSDIQGCYQKFPPENEENEMNDKVIHVNEYETQNRARMSFMCNSGVFRKGWAGGRIEVKLSVKYYLNCLSAEGNSNL